MSQGVENKRKHHDVVIIGAGPGGLQLGYFLKQAGIDYIILERGSGAGSSFERLPVHRTLLSVNKVHTGGADAETSLRWDWNSLVSDGYELRMREFDQAYLPHADSFVKYLQHFQRRTGIPVRFNCRVERIAARSEGGFTLHTAADGEFTCTLVVVATGTSVAHVPAIPGIELAEHYETHEHTPESCRDKSILIIGKGNSAFETGQEFIPYAARVHLISPHVLRMAWQSHFVGHLRQINSHLLETFFLKQQNAVLNGTIENIERRGDKLVAKLKYSENGYGETFAYDRVIVCTGYKFDVTPFARGGLRIDLVHDGKLPALTYEWESKSTPGVFFCGCLMQSNDYKGSASAFIHGYRFCAKTLSKYIARRVTGRSFPSVRVDPDPIHLFERIYRRLQTSPSLWHLHNYLCDAYVFDRKRGDVQCLEDVPVRMMEEEVEFKESDRVEFRFTFERPSDPVEREKFSSTGFIHPVLFLYRGGELIEERHVYEDVGGQWERPEFMVPFKNTLKKFARSLMSGGNMLESQKRAMEAVNSSRRVAQ